jgi:putative heme-binding domain-containing protein
MTKARSGLIYRGHVFASNYLGSVFIADPEAHVIHREILFENGLGWMAQRARDELENEFLISKDPSFHPTQIICGPDGALYVADMQLGGDSGRIYRIVPEGFKQLPVPRLGKLPTRELAAMLAHANGWHRDTAARLLVERHEPAAVSLLTNVVNNARIPLARLQALSALDGINGLTPAVLLKALRDADPHVRERAVALCEKIVNQENVPDPIWTQLAAMSADPSIRVRYQLAFTVGQIGRPQRINTLAQLITRDITNRWVQSAVLSSVNRGAGQLLVTLASDPRLRNPVALDFQSQLAVMVGAKGQLDEVLQALNFINGARLDSLTSFTLLHGLGEGLRRMGSSLALVDAQGLLQPFYDQALQVSLDTTVAEPLRVAAVQLRGVSPYSASDSGETLQAALTTSQPASVHRAIISALGRYENPVVASNLVASWAGFALPARRLAAGALLSRSDRVPLVVTGLEDGRLGVNDLTSPQKDFLRTYPDQTIAQRALRVLGPTTKGRPDVVERFRGALSVVGSPARGRDLFRERCTGCHRLQGEGFIVGPNLSDIKIQGRAKILSSIVQPNAEITPGFSTSVLESRHGDNLVGIITEANSVALSVNEPAKGQESWPRTNIQVTRAEPWSLMPEGLEEGMTTQNMADLLEYLITVPR